VDRLPRAREIPQQLRRYYASLVIPRSQAAPAKDTLRYSASSNSPYRVLAGQSYLKLGLQKSDFSFTKARNVAAPKFYSVKPFANAMKANSILIKFSDSVSNACKTKRQDLLI